MMVVREKGAWVNDLLPDLVFDFLMGITIFSSESNSSLIIIPTMGGNTVGPHYGWDHSSTPLWVGP